MRSGEIILFLLFNTGIIFGLYHWQTRLMTKKMARIKHEIQQLEDLVVAIVEELGEAVTVNQNDLQSEKQTKLKPQLKQVLSVPEIPAVALAQPSKLKTDSISGPASEEIPEESADQEPNIKNELIPPPKPKAKRNSVKSTPMALSSNKPNLSHANAAAVNPVVKSSAPLTKVSGSKQQKVLDLASQGLEVAEIAKQLKMGQGEIQLILGLYKESRM